MHDSHTHLSEEPLKSGFLEQVKNFKDIGGKYILNVSFNLESINDVISQSIELENKFPNIVQTGIGLHPVELSDITNMYLHKEIDKEIEIVEQTLQTHRKRIRAIGECGLDYYHLYSRKDFSKEEQDERIDVQKYTLRKHLEIALANNLPLTLHSRDAQDSSLCISDMLKIVSTTGKGLSRGCFHSFTGSKEYLNEILSLGFYIGFNGIITYPKAENVRELLRITPIERILIETDAPYLPPRNVRSGKSGNVKYGKPSDVVEIIEKAAKEKNITVEKFTDLTTQNYENLFLSD